MQEMIHSLIILIFLKLPWQVKLRMVPVFTKTGHVLYCRPYLFFKHGTGVQKRLTINEDFKWTLSQFNSRPLVNDRDEMILMSSANKGFVVFNLDSILAFEKPGTVRLIFYKTG